MIPIYKIPMTLVYYSDYDLLLWKQDALTEISAFLSQDTRNQVLTLPLAVLTSDKLQLLRAQFLKLLKEEF